MKIGILLPSVYMHGVEFKKRISAPMDLSITLADGLVEAGNEVLFFSGPDIPTKAKVVSPADTILLDRKMRIDYQQDLLPEAYTAVSFYEQKKYFEMEVTKLAYEFARKEKVSILHLYHAYGNLAHYFTELLNFPTVYTLHVLPPPTDTFETWRYTRFKTQNFISISNSQKKEFLQLVPEMNITNVIYHGVSLSKYVFDDSGSENLIFIGRLIPQKGLDIALNIALKTNKKIEIATDINKVIEKSTYYKDAIVPLLSTPLVHMHGLLASNQKIDFLKKAKAFLFPLQWDEPFGMVLIESMACGTPVIAFARGSIPEIIEDGVTGFLVNPSDTDIKGNFVIKKTGMEGMLEAVERIYNLPKEEYKKMRKNCRELVEQKFSVEKMVENYERVYEKILLNNSKTT